MPSGLKKRRAEKKRSDTNTKTPTNPACDSYEEKVVAGLECETVDQRTIETPLMVDILNSLAIKEEKVAAALECEIVDQKTVEIPLTVDDNYEEKVVAALECELVDQKTVEIPLTVDDTYEEKVVAALQSKTVDQKTIGTPLMVDDTHENTPLIVDDLNSLASKGNKGKRATDAVEFQTIDQKANEMPFSSKKTEPSISHNSGELGSHDLMEIFDPLDSETEDAHRSKNKPASYASPALINPADTISEENQDISLKKPAVIHHSLSVEKSVKTSSIDQVDFGQRIKLLEQLLSISAEIDIQAEKHASLAKECSLNLSLLMEELKFNKLK